jgi:uncharacterized protein
MEHFTPVSASIGGMLIGLSANMLWLANGRIAGISGIVGGLWTIRSGMSGGRSSAHHGLHLCPSLIGGLLAGALKTSRMPPSGGLIRSEDGSLAPSAR